MVGLERATFFFYAQCLKHIESLFPISYVIFNTAVKANNRKGSLAAIFSWLQSLQGEISPVVLYISLTKIWPKQPFSLPSVAEVNYLQASIS